MDGWEHAATADPDPDSWDAVPATADEAGVTAAEHVKASNGTAEEAAPDAIPEPVRRAVLSRQTASARCSEAAALHAQARQAIRRTVACAADVLALREAGLGNIAYVRALWAAFEAGGVAAMAALVPADVQWRPLGAAGRVLYGTREVTEFWASRDAEMPTGRSVSPVISNTRWTDREPGMITSRMFSAAERPASSIVPAIRLSR